VEGLFSVRPYSAGGGERGASSAAGRRPVPRGSGARCSAGLSLDASQRYESVDALVAALQKYPERVGGAAS